MSWQLVFAHLRFAQNLLELGFQSFEQLLNAISQAFGFTCQSVTRQQPAHARVALGERQYQHQGVFTAIFGRINILQDAVDTAENGLFNKADQALEHFRLAGKMTVQGGFRNTDLLGQVGSGDTRTRLGFQHMHQSL